MRSRHQISTPHADNLTVTSFLDNHNFEQLFGSDDRHSGHILATDVSLVFTYTIRNMGFYCLMFVDTGGKGREGAWRYRTTEHWDQRPGKPPDSDDPLARLQGVMCSATLLFGPSNIHPFCKIFVDTLSTLHIFFTGLDCAKLIRVEVWRRPSAVDNWRGRRRRQLGWFHRPTSDADALLLSDKRLFLKLEILYLKIFRQ